MEVEGVSELSVRVVGHPPVPREAFDCAVERYGAILEFC